MEILLVNECVPKILLVRHFRSHVVGLGSLRKGKKNEARGASHVWIYQGCKGVNVNFLHPVFHPANHTNPENFTLFEKENHQKKPPFWVSSQACEVGWCETKTKGLDTAAGCSGNGTFRYLASLTGRDSDCNQEV